MKKRDDRSLGSAGPNNPQDGAPVDATELPDEIRLRDQVCPQCRQPFELRWKDYERDGAGYRDVTTTLQIRGCPSGGIYDVLIRCPHCGYEEPL